MERFYSLTHLLPKNTILNVKQIKRINFYSLFKSVSLAFVKKQINNGIQFSGHRTKMEKNLGG